MKNDKNIYVKIIDILEASPKTRRALIGAYIDTLGLTREQLADKSTGSIANIRRSTVGTVIDEMTDGREGGMAFQVRKYVSFRHSSQSCLL